MHTDPIKKLSKEFQDFRKGIYHAETLSGVLTKHQKGSSASGMYGIQWGQMKGAKADNYYSDLNKTEFLADTALQSQVLLDRYNDEMPGVKGYKTTAEFLRKKYQPEITKTGGDFDYSDDELAALVHFLGRDGAREYLGYHKRDKKPLHEALPNIYGPGKNIKNMTPTEYLEKYRKGKEGNFRYGGEVKKYAHGGYHPEETLFNIDPYQSNIGQGELIESASAFAEQGQSIDLSGLQNASAGDYAWDNVPEQDFITEQGGKDLAGKLGTAASVAKVAYEVGSDFKQGHDYMKDFYSETYDPRVGFDSDQALKDLKEARAQKAGAVAEGTAYAATIALTGNPALATFVGNVSEKLGEGVSKLFGPGKKAKERIEERASAVTTYQQGVLADEAEIKQKKLQYENLSKYLTEMSQPNSMAFAKLGGMLYGPSHEQGGIPIEVEGGEFIVKKSAIDDNKVKTITGTNKQIASKINADAGGKNPFPGAKINIYG